MSVIDELKHELLNMFDEARRSGTARHQVKRTHNGYPKTERLPDTRPAKLAAIKAAMKECDDLVYAALTANEFTDRIAKIRANINLPTWLLDAPPEPVASAAE